MQERELSAELALLREEVHQTLETQRQTAGSAGRSRAQQLVVTTDRMRRWRPDTRSAQGSARPGAETRIAGQSSPIIAGCLAKFSQEMVELLRQEKVAVATTGRGSGKAPRAIPRRERALRLTQALLHAESVLNAWSAEWEARWAGEPHPSTKFAGPAAIAHATKQRAEWQRDDDHQRALAQVQLAGAERAAEEADMAAVEAEHDLLATLEDMTAEDWLRVEAKAEAVRRRQAATAIRAEAVSLVTTLENQASERRTHGAGAVADLEAVWAMDPAETNDVLFAAATADDIPLLRRVIEAGADLTVTNEVGLTPLEVAVSRHKLRAALLLLDHECAGVLTAAILTRLGPAAGAAVPPVPELEGAVVACIAAAGGVEGFGLDLEELCSFEGLRVVGKLLVSEISAPGYSWIGRYIEQLESGNPLISEAEELQMMADAEAVVANAKARAKAEEDGRLEAEFRTARLKAEEEAAVARKKDAQQAAAVAAMAREMEATRLKKEAEVAKEEEEARAAAEAEAKAAAEVRRKEEEWERSKKAGEELAARIKAETVEAALLKAAEEKRREQEEEEKARLKEELAMLKAEHEEDEAKFKLEQKTAAVSKIQAMQRGKLQRRKYEERRAAINAENDAAAAAAAVKRAEEMEVAAAQRALEDQAASAYREAVAKQRAEEEAMVEAVRLKQQEAALAVVTLPAEPEPSPEPEQSPAPEPEPSPSAEPIEDSHSDHFQHDGPIPRSLRRYTRSRTGDGDWMVLWYFLGGGHNKRPAPLAAPRLQFKRRNWGPGQHDWNDWHIDDNGRGAVLCAGGWWHSQPVDLHDWPPPSASTTGRPGTPSGGHPSGSAQAVALPWEYSVWVDGRLRGLFGGDSSSVLLEYPALSQHRLLNTAGSAAGSNTADNRPSAVRRMSFNSSATRLQSQATPRGDVDGEAVADGFASETPRTELLEEALELMAAERWSEAESAFLVVAEQDPSRADLCIYNVAVVQEQLGNYDDAHEIYSNVSQRRMALLDPADPPDQLLLRARMGIVNTLEQRGEHEAAEELCKTVHADQEQQLGHDHPETLRSLMNLAGFLGDRGELEEAKRLTVEAHSKQLSQLGETHPDVQVSVHNMQRLGLLQNAEVQRKQRRPSTGQLERPASRSTERASSSRRSARPPAGGPDAEPGQIGQLIGAQPLLTPRGVMWEDATALQAGGHLMQAEQAFLSLAEHPDIDQEPGGMTKDMCLYNVAVMAEQRGDYELADEVYGTVESHRLLALGPGAPPDQLLLRVRMGVVNLLDEQGHLEAAEELCRSVSKLQSDHLGPDHPDTLRSQMNLAGFAQERGELDEAKAMITEVHTKQAAALGKDHPDVLLSRCASRDRAQHGDGDGAPPA